VLYAGGGVATTAATPPACSTVAGTLFLAGVARAGGWLAAGTPDKVQRALLAIELGAPPAIVAWQARM
jgi:hypothetical protein